jgi:hypothetical protein
MFWRPDLHRRPLVPTPRLERATRLVDDLLDTYDLPAASAAGKAA